MEGFFIPDDDVGFPDKAVREHSYEMTKASAIWSMGMIKAGLAADAEGIKEGLRFINNEGFGKACLLALLSHVQNLVKLCQDNNVSSMYDNLAMEHVDAYVSRIEQVCVDAEKQFQKADKAVEN